MNKTSIRYGGGSFDVRSAFIRMCGFLQRKKIIIINSKPKICGEILAASDTKGSFVEHIFATPAWHPIYSIESVDGELWEQLAKDCRKVISQIKWRDRLGPLTKKYISQLVDKINLDPTNVIDSECITRLVLRIMFELLFDTSITAETETLFYQASIEWRKEIGIKGPGNHIIKTTFWSQLFKIVEESNFGQDLHSYKADPARWLSVFAQPFLISPQINISDIMVAVFHFLRVDPKRLEEARRWTATDDKLRLSGIILESIRLQHPFPILERELQQNMTIQGKSYESHTQFFLLYDQFQQDQTFDPERWLANTLDNPYYSIPFGAGPRMCIGKPIAIELLVDLLKAFISQFPENKIQPNLGHLYSGRDNDGNQSLTEVAYQLKIFGRGLWKSFLIGRSKKRVRPKGLL